MLSGLLVCAGGMCICGGTSWMLGGISVAVESCLKGPCVNSSHTRRRHTQQIYPRARRIDLLTVEKPVVILAYQIIMLHNSQCLLSPNQYPLIPFQCFAIVSAIVSWWLTMMLYYRLLGLPPPNTFSFPSPSSSRYSHILVILSLVIEY